MTRGGITPARIAFDTDGVPRSLDYGDVYHARAGAWQQAQQVFLAGNELPRRWQRRRRFVVAETGFGLGHNFLATWTCWRDDPARCEQLWYLAIDRHPPTRDDLLRVHAASPQPALAAALVDAWPPLTPDLHAIEFDGGRVQLRLLFADLADALPRLVARADAFFLDGFAPDRNPAMWSPAVLERLNRLAAPDATVATWSVARTVRDALSAAGFVVERASGFAGKRARLVGRFAPRFAREPPPGRRAGSGGTAAIVGAGLAGAACARSLRRHGVEVAVFEQRGSPKVQRHGPPLGGLLHGVVHAEDGIYARWHRAAFAHAARELREAIAHAGVIGALDGALRLAAGASVEAMRAQLQRLALPEDYVTALDATQAGLRAGLPLRHPAWWYPAGGWVDPRSVIEARLGGVELRANVRIERIERDADGRWQLIDDGGDRVATADHVVLACSHDAERLAPGLAVALRASRGQVTLLPPATPRLPRLQAPLAGDGYAISLPDGTLLCGATHDLGDDEAALREGDHRRNLAALAQLLGTPLADVDHSALGGRVGWRLVTPDRLPLIGALPDASPPPSRARVDQPRFVARQPGLHVLAGFGSRGLAQSALGGEIVASWISGAPLPVTADLLDAVDVARFRARAARGPRPGS